MSAEANTKNSDTVDTLHFQKRVTAGKKLHLRVLSSAFLDKGTILQMNALGLAGDNQPLRQAYDGITYFGCKKSAPLDGETGEGTTGGVALPYQTGDDQEQIVNDFVIPAVKPEEVEKHQGR